MLSHTHPQLHWHRPAPLTAAGQAPPPLPLLGACQVWVNHSYRILYLRHAKTASSSLLCHFKGCGEAANSTGGSSSIDAGGAGGAGGGAGGDAQAETSFKLLPVGVLHSCVAVLALRPLPMPMQPPAGLREPHPAVMRPQPSALNWLSPALLPAFPLALQNLVTPERLQQMWADYFVVTFVRNPYQRAVSSYRMMARQLAPAGAAAGRRTWDAFCADPAGFADTCMADARCQT